MRPWSKTITLRVSDEALSPGDEVVLVLGDPSFESPGFRAQTHPELPFRYRVQVDPFGTGVWEALSEDGGATPRILRIGLPDRYVTHGKPALLHAEVGFTGVRIAERIEAAVADPRSALAGL